MRQAHAKRPLCLLPGSASHQQISPASHLVIPQGLHEAAGQRSQTVQEGGCESGLVAAAELPQVVSDAQPGFGEFLDSLGSPAWGVLS